MSSTPTRLSTSSDDASSGTQQIIGFGGRDVGNVRGFPLSASRVKGCQDDGSGFTHHTVDGKRNPVNSPVVVGSLSHGLRWCRISEPSTVSLTFPFGRWIVRLPAGEKSWNGHGRNSRVLESTVGLLTLVELKNWDGI